MSHAIRAPKGVAARLAGLLTMDKMLREASADHGRASSASSCARSISTRAVASSRMSAPPAAVGHEGGAAQSCRCWWVSRTSVRSSSLSRCRFWRRWAQDTISAFANRFFRTSRMFLAAVRHLQERRNARHAFIIHCHSARSHSIRWLDWHFVTHLQWIGQKSSHHEVKTSQ